MYINEATSRTCGAHSATKFIAQSSPNHISTYFYKVWDPTLAARLPKRQGKIVLSNHDKFVSNQAADTHRTVV